MIIENMKKVRVGTSNPAYGKIWITKDNNHKRIYANNIDFYITLGWSKGRRFSNSHNVNLQIDFSTRNLDPLTHKILKKEVIIKNGNFN